MKEKEASMSIKIPEQNSETEVFQIIETTIDDLSVLTRAFEVIKAVCEEEQDLSRLAIDCESEVIN